MGGRLLSDDGTCALVLVQLEEWRIAIGDIEQPVATPRGLAPDDPVSLELLARAVKALNDEGIPLDARLDEIQGVRLPGGEQFPLHGGSSAEGVFNATTSPLRPPRWRPGRAARNASSTPRRSVL